MLRLVEVSTEFHDLGAKGGYGEVLIRRITHRYIDRGRNAEASGGKCDGLTMITPRGGDDPGDLRVRLSEPIQIDQAASDLESSRGRVIFVLYPHIATDASAQLWPAILGCRRDCPMDELCGFLQFSPVGDAAGQWQCSRSRSQPQAFQILTSLDFLMASSCVASDTS